VSRVWQREASGAQEANSAGMAARMVGRCELAAGVRGLSR
jgi:hypothetical protein